MHVVVQAYVLLRPTPHSQDNLTKLIQKDVFAAYHLSALHENSNAVHSML